LTLDITVPVNTNATIYGPAGKQAAVKEGGKPAELARGLKLRSRDDEAAVYDAGSGRYSFSVQ
jgi:alpha-L-rhamnosidase